MALKSSNTVQMRRSTNRKGKQAPVPPKRTSLLSSSGSFRDCSVDDSAINSEVNALNIATNVESENGCSTANTDEFPENNNANFLPSPATGSFKRTPIMGSRSLALDQQQRSKKSQTYPTKEYLSSAPLQKVCFESIKHCLGFFFIAKQTFG